jgi:hypothetical protein
MLANFNTIRSGSADKVELWQLLEEFGSDNSKIHKLADITSGSYKEKIRFLNGLVAQGPKYIGFNGESLDLELGTNPDIDIHVLHFSETAKTHAELWKQNLAVLHQIINDATRQSRIVSQGSRRI